jgi:hypothetical protein
MSEKVTLLLPRDAVPCASGLSALPGASGTDAVLNRGQHDPAAAKAAVLLAKRRGLQQP